MHTGHMNTKTTARHTYSLVLRILALTAVVCFAMLVVMTDANEDREAWEFVPVETTGR